MNFHFPLERETQNDILAHFTSLWYENLGRLPYSRSRDFGIEEKFLQKFLSESQKVDEKIFQKIIAKIAEETRKTTRYKFEKISKPDLFESNQNFYNLLRYGVKIQPEISANTETFWLVDWKNPEKNHFAVAEEVTIVGTSEQRIDLVIYINGIALAVIEAKKWNIPVEEAIRQNIANQKEIPHFFATIQWIVAINLSQWIRYGTINASQQFFLPWREEIFSQNNLPKYLFEISCIFSKSRFLDLIENFVTFDDGIKKLCRPHQFFGILAARNHIDEKKWGIIWHTQWSGKSLTMTWLAKWILENYPMGRILIITDRTELDDQIEKVFKNVNENIQKAENGTRLVSMLKSSENRLICSLIHKFGAADNNENNFIKKIENTKILDTMYVFVDECHRTQSGELHTAMKKMLPNAVFIGFTGTPIFKSEKALSQKIFGNFIHSYKVDQAIADGVVLDLHYEARNIEQNITRKDEIDNWFEEKTSGLSEYARKKLKKRWATNNKIMSSKNRLEKIVNDIIADFDIQPRLSDGTGNAMLVASSVYEACKFYELFFEKNFTKIAVISSYNPITNTDDTGNNDTESEWLEKQRIYKKMLANYYNVDEGRAFTFLKKFEEDAKKQFIEHPNEMKLLIVVDKLLTGFDSPATTFLYIDKEMRDHGLFQAITRVNRVHNETKLQGCIVDYKNLFGKIQDTITTYSANNPFDKYDADDIKNLISDNNDKLKEKFFITLEQIRYLCEWVSAPKNIENYITYFSRYSENTETQDFYEANRHQFYKLVASLVYNFSYISDEDISKNTKDEIAFYVSAREAIQLATDEYVDFKAYDESMRHIIDQYISANESTKKVYENAALIESLISQPQKVLDDLEIFGDKGSREIIEWNMRALLIEKKSQDPAYFESLSELLENLIEKRKNNNISLEEYTEQISEIAKKIQNTAAMDLPAEINSPEKRALYHFFDKNIELALMLNDIIQREAQSGWRENTFKTKKLQQKILPFFPETYDIERFMELLKNQKNY